jgi:hypothetical protein
MSAILSDLPPQPRNAAVPASAARPAVAWLLLGGLWGYLVIAGLWLAHRWGSDEFMQWFYTWHALPSQIVALGMMLPMIRGLESGFRRIGWQLIFWAGISDAIAEVWWAYLQVKPALIDSGWNDIPYIVYYLIAAAAFVMFYRDLGGSFRRRQVWLDIFTLALGLCATLWLFLLEPELQKLSVREANMVSLIGYFVGDAVMLTVVSLLIMQI